MFNEFTVVSICLNVFLAVIIAWQYRQIKSKNKQPDLDATRLLHDLTTHGKAMVKVSYIDPTDYLITSPR